MTFYEQVDRIVALLQSHGRVSYRALKRELGIDDDELADLAAELVEVQRLAVEEDGKILAWAGAPSSGAAGGPLPAAGAGAEAERRQVTVMFCDLAGSTGLAERLDPEDLRSVLREYRETVAAVVHRFEGVVARYVGDGLLIYFGYPRAHEDEAARAVRAGLQIVEAVARLAASEPLQVRIGIHTGLAVIGDIGDGDQREPMAAIGETPNIAARLQGFAEPGAVVLSEATHRLLRGACLCEPLGAQALRGITQPVPAYRALRERMPDEMPEAGGPLLSTPLVGRKQEMALLEGRWERAGRGHGQVALLIGDAGIGKSRLVRALEARVASGPHRRLKARGSPFHQNSALAPAVQLLQQILGWDEGASSGERLDRLEAALAAAGLPVGEAAPLLAPLLGSKVPDGRYPARALTPERRRRETLSALATLVLRAGAPQPTLLVVEDLHWVDASTLEWLGLAIERAATAPILVVLTARTGFAAPWRETPDFVSMALSRLARADVERVVEAVAAGRVLPPALVEQIVAKTDGVPLFVEELTKMLLESDQVGVADDPQALARPLMPLEVPSSLQDSLVARLDHLATVKTTAQLASVVGRQFSYALLRAVSQSSDDALRRDLARLVDAELLYQWGAPPKATYTFKHALIQDAAYQMLLKSTRQQHHLRVARALDGQFGAAPEILAHHYTEAGLAAEALRNWQRAGEEAVKRLAYVEAIGHLGAGLRVLDSVPDSPERRRQELALRIASGVPLVAAKGYGAPEVEESYVRARELCLELDDPVRLFSAVRGLWNLRLVRAELAEAHVLGEQLLDLASRSGDAGARVAAHRAMGVTSFKRGEYAAAREHFERAIAAYDPTLHASLVPEHGADPCVVCMVYSGTTSWALGYPDQGLRYIEDGLALARGLRHNLSIAVALTTASRFHQVRRERAAASDHAMAVIALSEELGLPYWAALGTTLQGWASAKDGRAEEGIAAIERGRAALRATGAALIEPWNLSVLADARREAGESEAGLALLVEAQALAAATGERWWEAELHRLEGELRLDRPDGAARRGAEECFRRALAVARRQGARSLELRAATSLARLWQASGRRDEARRLLGDAYEWFTEGFDAVDLVEARATLEALRDGGAGRSADVFESHATAARDGRP